MGTGRRLFSNRAGKRRLLLRQSSAGPRQAVGHADSHGEQAVSRDGHLRAGHVDLQADDDQRRATLRLLCQLVPRAAFGTRVVRPQPERRVSRDRLLQLEGPDTSSRPFIRPVRQWQDGPQSALGQVRWGVERWHREPDWKPFDERDQDVA